MAEQVTTPPTETGAPPRRMRSRLARLTSPRLSADPALEPLLRTLRSTHPRADTAVVARAYEVAAKAHEGQFRKSGEPYITHPLAVAMILAELGMTPPTLRPPVPGVPWRKGTTR